MEQTIQKPPFPIKTKIAAWWMIISGILLFVISALILLSAGYMTPFKLFIYVGVVSLFCILLISFSLLLFITRRKWVWMCSIVLLSCLLIFITYFLIYYARSLEEARRELGLRSCTPIQKTTYAALCNPIKESSKIAVFYFFIIPPFILLLLDRKNFWKIAA